MPDYQEMYQNLFRATEQSIRTLIQAQQACEELYLNQLEPELRLLSRDEEDKKG